MNGKFPQYLIAGARIKGPRLNFKILILVLSSHWSLSPHMLTLPWKYITVIFFSAYFTKFAIVYWVLELICENSSCSLHLRCLKTLKELCLAHKIYGKEVAIKCFVSISIVNGCCTFYISQRFCYHS